MPDFSEYIDGEKSRDVWIDYKQELDNLDLVGPAETIVGSTDNSFDLGIRLETLVSEERVRNSFRQRH